MKKGEAKMTESDFKKIISNDKNSTKIGFILFLVMSLIFYFKWNSIPLFFQIIFILIFCLSISMLWEGIFKFKQNKDLRERIKITIETTVIKKKIIDKTDFSKDSSRASDIIYRLTFKNKRYYEVKRYIYEKIEIGSTVNIEYAKNTKWILNINQGTINLINRDYLQKYK